DTAAGHCETELIAFNGLQLQSAAAGLDLFHEPGRAVGSRYDVIGEHPGQRRLVLWLHEVVDGACGKLCKCIIGWCEHREGTRAVEGIHQARCPYRRDERLMNG